MPTIHVHDATGREVAVFTRKRPSMLTRDAGSLRALYDDLAERMALCLRDTLAKSRTGDDLHGHEFHGNQHTGGIGGKTKAEHIAHVHAQGIKSNKAKIHALLTSGHPFSKDELAIAVGMDPKGKTINDYLTNLKNPKFAGPKGALKIDKNAEGLFYVALPNGQPAPPPDTKLDLTQVTAPPVAAPPPVVHAPPPPPIVEVPHVEEVPPVLTPTQTETALSIMKGAVPGSMSKDVADKLYQEHLKKSFDQLEAGIEEGENTHAALLAFKVDKVMGMAAWAQAVHGTPFKAPQQQLFKADKQLATDIHDSIYHTTKTQEQLLDAWKKNTAAEKAGNFPPKVIQPTTYPKPTPAPTAAPVSVMPAAVPVKPRDYDALVPDSHEDIQASDILKGKFADGILSLRSNMMNDSKSSETNKTTVEQALRKRLKDKPNFQALVKKLGLPASGIGSLESRLIGAWAANSGDGRELSCALQMAVKDAFAVPDDAVHLEPLSALTITHKGDVDSLSVAAANGLRTTANTYGPAFTKAEAPAIRAAFQEFAQAQYDNTQDYFKDKGIDHVYVVRGMTIKANSDKNKIGASALKLQPASSFSSDYGVSRNSFSSMGNSVFLCKVPRQQILGTYLTGYGCTGEHELVVMGHDKLKTYPVPYEGIASAQEAETYVKHQLMQEGAAVHKVPAKGSLEEHQAKIMKKYF